MGSNDNPGDFEQLVLLALLRLGENAYGMTVRREIEERTGRDISLGAVYSTLDRMERKGWVESHRDDATEERNRRAKRFFRVDSSGRSALADALSRLDQMRDGLGDLAPAGGAP